MTNPLTPLSHRDSANDAVHSALRNAILNSVLKPGERLNIPELASQLGVSLTPVRNAVQLLTAEGLIEVRPRSGTFVASVSVQDVRETFEIRCALECLAAERACERMTDAEIKLMNRHLLALRKPIRDDDARARHERDNAAFHMTILEGAHNERLIDAYQRLNSHIQIARIHASENGWQLRLKAEQEEHDAIAAAIEARDSAAAVTAMRAHLARACASLIDAIECTHALRNHNNSHP